MLKTRTSQRQEQINKKDRPKTRKGQRQGLVKDRYGVKDMSKTRVVQKPQRGNLQGQVKDKEMLKTERKM